MAAATSALASKRLVTLVFVHAAGLVAAAIAIHVIGASSWKPLGLLVLLAAFAFGSEAIGRKLGVAGEINVSASDVYLVAILVLVGPLPALVVALVGEVCVASMKPRLRPLVLLNNLLGLASYVLVATLLLVTLAGSLSLGHSDLGFLALVAITPTVANAACFLVIAGGWQLAFKESFRDAAHLFVRFLPWEGIAGVLVAVGVYTYAGSGARGFVPLLAAFAVSEMLVRRLSRVEVALRTEKAKAERYLDIAATMIAVTDRDGRLTLVNRRGCEILGATEEALLGRPLEDVVQDPAPIKRLLARETDELAFEAEVTRTDGDNRIVAWHVRVLSGELSGLLVSGEDVTERRRAEREVRFLAFHDRLTRIGNRAEFDRRLVTALGEAQATGAGIALIYVDVDDLKQVNDTLGHGAGDELLREVARRLRQTIRGRDFVARHGGDEFAVLLTAGDETRESTQAVADRIEQALAEPFRIGGRKIIGGASVGFALFPDDGADADSLLRAADDAMYDRKRSRRAA